MAKNNLKLKKAIFVVITVVFMLTTANCSYSQEKQESKEPSVQNAQAQNQEIAGELFGVPVPKENYYFAMRTALTFNTPWGSIPRNRKQLEQRTWTDLLLSYEAFRQGIEVSQKEINKEVTKTLDAYKVDFDWEKDKEAYKKWVKKTLNEPVELFENQIRHLIQLKKLRNQILNDIEPTVTEEEAFQEFLDEHNTLSVELAQFETKEVAEKFYEKVKKNPELWDEKAKEDKEKPKKERDFRRPGFVALEFLMHMWKFPREAVYEMIEEEKGYIHRPEPIYKGYGVFKVLKIRRANEEDFSKQKERYFKQLKSEKKHKGFYEWLKDLRKEADIKKYMKPPEGIFQQTSPESN